VAEAMKITATKEPEAKTDETVEFIDPLEKNIDVIQDVQGDGMLFAKLSRGADDAI